MFVSLCITYDLSQCALHFVVFIQTSSECYMHQTLEMQIHANGEIGVRSTGDYCYFQEGCEEPICDHIAFCHADNQPTPTVSPRTATLRTWSEHYFQAKVVSVHRGLVLNDCVS